MEIISEFKELKEKVRGWRMLGHRVGIVPTMGALHAGHLQLVEKAKLQNDVVIVSIFVNPTQFAPNEDFDKYPRDLEKDSIILSNAGCDLIYAPMESEMYSPGFCTSIDPGPLAKDLEGEFRPTHFAGVAVVVTKLLLQALPDTAYFGEKDYQQLMIIQRVVLDLNIPTEIVPVGIVREADGLALSSRNAYLNDRDRERALLLSATLRKAIAAVTVGGTLEDAINSGMEDLESAGFQVDYLEIRDAKNLMPVKDISNPSRILVAARIGGTRLIDNMRIS